MVDMGDDGDVAELHGAVLNRYGPPSGPQLVRIIAAEYSQPPAIRNAGQCDIGCARVAGQRRRYEVPFGLMEDRRRQDWRDLLRFPKSISSTRRILCVFPAYTPSFGTFSHAYRLMHGVRAFMPPQGLLLIAAYMPAAAGRCALSTRISRRANAADFAWADVGAGQRHAHPGAADSRYRPRAPKPPARSPRSAARRCRALPKCIRTSTTCISARSATRPTG